jgi:hypothetical protein
VALALTFGLYGLVRKTVPVDALPGFAAETLLLQPTTLAHPRLFDALQFQEREIGGAWLPRRVRRGELFVTGSKTPYELRWNSPLGAELELVHIHLAVDQLTAALETVYQDKAAAVEVIEFFGRDETLAYLSFACVELISAGTAGNAKRIASFAHLLTIYIAEKYTNVAS